MKLYRVVNMIEGHYVGPIFYSKERADTYMMGMSVAMARDYAVMPYIGQISIRVSKKVSA